MIRLSKIEKLNEEFNAKIQSLGTELQNLMENIEDGDSIINSINKSYTIAIGLPLCVMGFGKKRMSYRIRSIVNQYKMMTNRKGSWIWGNYGHVGTVDRLLAINSAIKDSVSGNILYVIATISPTVYNLNIIGENRANEANEMSLYEFINSVNCKDGECLDKLSNIEYSIENTLSSQLNKRVELSVIIDGDIKKFKDTDLHNLMHILKSKLDIISINEPLYTQPIEINGTIEVVNGIKFTQAKDGYNVEASVLNLVDKANLLGVIKCKLRNASNAVVLSNNLIGETMYGVIRTIKNLYLDGIESIYMELPGQVSNRQIYYISELRRNVSLLKLIVSRDTDIIKRIR